MTARAVPHAPWLDGWGADCWSFNVDLGAPGDEADAACEGDGSGRPGRALVGGAITCWAARTPGADAATASLAFNLPVVLAEDAFRPDLFPASDLSDAVQVWSLLVGVDADVGLAAAVFGVQLGVLAAVVHDHPWMYVERRADRDLIGHEGY